MFAPFSKWSKQSKACRNLTFIRKPLDLNCTRELGESWGSVLHRLQILTSHLLSCNFTSYYSHLVPGDRQRVWYWHYIATASTINRAQHLCVIWLHLTIFWQFNFSFSNLRLWTFQMISCSVCPVWKSQLIHHVSGDVGWSDHRDRLDFRGVLPWHCKSCKWIWVYPASLSPHSVWIPD